MSVPPDAATLSLHLQSSTDDTLAEMHLYDCTTGQCFSYNIGVPAAHAHSLVVRKPAAGRWVAAVSAAPIPDAAGAFVLDEIITAGNAVRRASVMRGPNARWREALDLPQVASPPASPGTTAIWLVELRDAALERDGDAHPWTKTPRFKLRDRPASLATAFAPR
jgi:hypothetical protein